MKIAMVAPPWLPLPPHGYGGIEEVVYLLTEELVRRGHEVLLFAPGDSKTRAKLFPTVPAHVGQDLPLELKRALAHVTSSYAYARAAIEKVDLVHDHTLFQSDLPIPAVHTLHGPPVGLGTAESISVAEICREMSRKGNNYFVAISYRQQALYGTDINWAGVVYNGIDTKSVPFYPDPGDYLVFLGRASAEKGPDIAARVAVRARRCLVMSVKMTEFQERTYFRLHVEPLLAEGCIRVMGEVPLGRKWELFGKGLATLFPIQWEEPFGLVTIESMATGTPVLAFPRGSVPEIVVDGVTGFLCKTEDEMVTAVEKVRLLGRRKCREHVETKFSVAQMADGYERVYAEVLGIRRKAAA